MILFLSSTVISDSNESNVNQVGRMIHVFRVKAKADRRFPVNVQRLLLGSLSSTGPMISLETLGVTILFKVEWSNT